MELVHNLPVNELTIRQLAQKVGANADRVHIKMVDDLLIHEKGESLGITTDNGNRKFTIQICDHEVHKGYKGSMFHTLVHELVHIAQSVQGKEFDCCEADRVAEEILGV